MYLLRVQSKSMRSSRFLQHQGGFLHYNFVVALLSDLFGIQAPGGCSCARPYGARLFGMTGEGGHAYLSLSAEGLCSAKPGWARVNFDYFISEREFRYIVEAVQLVAMYGYVLLPRYTLDPNTGLWSHRSGKPHHLRSLSDLQLVDGEARWNQTRWTLPEGALDEQLSEGHALLRDAERSTPDKIVPDPLSRHFERWRWSPLPHEEVAWLRRANGAGEVPVVDLPFVVQERF